MILGIAIVIGMFVGLCSVFGTAETKEDGSRGWNHEGSSFKNCK